VNQEQWEGQEKAPVVISVRLKCDDPGCDTPLVVLAPRKTSDTTAEDIQKELLTWTLHDLFCPSEHPVSRVFGLQ